MDIQTTREYKAAKDLERALNDYGWNPKGLQKVQGSFIVHCSRI